MFCCIKINAGGAKGVKLFPGIFIETQFNLSNKKKLQNCKISSTQKKRKENEKNKFNFPRDLSANRERRNT